ncbi:hypothetical protein [Aeromonas veronii]|uniref:hypothetical protein n=1 Tax=Aeromonas veronii TaxID=654 RepID=UPI000955DDA0|nr:hypothetical protein [Aeromonas veronii]SIQ79831.1 hypothetical protein SAMN05892873_11659 [Aeromonas veronii]
MKNYKSFKTMSYVQLRSLCKRWGTIRDGSLWASIKLAIELQYMELSIFSVASEYRLATSQDQSAIARRKYTDKNSNIRFARGKLAYQQEDIFT